MEGDRRALEGLGACDGAAQVGNLLLERLRQLQGKHDIIGDVRGQGLMLGLEMVTDRASKAPATKETMQVSHRPALPRNGHSTSVCRGTVWRCPRPTMREKSWDV